MPVQPAIIPCLAYRDAHAAIEFLCDAFGFARNAIYESEDKSRVDHAQLTLDGNMVMLSSASRQSEDRLGMATPAETGGKVTACIYVVLGDPDAHHARAAAAGARIINPPTDQDYGGRSYEARDLEGNVWSFGTYDPFEVFQEG
ncbi:VOC family protein [Enterovirga sp. GCM10030262]|uniref:VOC family protein n=1 Tax=Enterovirga sp. GCM10030262 TaxID=3273391 RepID=UPI00361D2538